MNDKHEEMPVTDESGSTEMISSEDDNSETQTVQTEAIENLVSAVRAFKSDIELIKLFPQILGEGNHISLNLTLNDIKGDNYSDNAINTGAGHDNVYNGAVCFGHNMPTMENTEKKTSVDLSNYSEIFKYLKEEQQSPYCAFLIVLAIFNNTQFDLVSSEAKIFFDMLAEERREVTNDKNETVIVKKKLFEISRQEASSNFGVEFYQNMLITAGGRFLTSFIRFSSEEHSLNVLRCVYSEFVVLRDKVTAFLTKLICSEKVALFATAINTLKKICDINPEYFMSTIVARLIQNKSIPSDIAISQILCSIAQHSKSEYSADKYLKFFSNVDRDIHYYIVTLMMCKTLSYKRDKIGKLLRPVLWELINQPRLELLLGKLKIDLPDEENFINNIDLFFNIGNRYAEYYIALISELHGILVQMKRNDNRWEFVQFVTLLFIREDYNESCLNSADPSKFKDMIFIRMVLRDNDTASNLIFLWMELLKNRRFKRAAEKILEDYLNMRNDFTVDEIEYLKIETFFSKLMQQESVRNNLIFFLMNISTRPINPIALAGKIYHNIGGN